MAGGIEEKITQFCAVVGTEDRVYARNLLAACNDNLESAIDFKLRMDSEDGSGASSEPVDNSNQKRDSSLPLSQQNGASGGSGSRDEGTSGPAYSDEPEVRAPIPQRREVLVEPEYEPMPHSRASTKNRRGRVRSVFDGFRNFEAETLSREESEQEPPGYSRNKKKTLEELFKPPLDIMYQGDWQSTRDHATNLNRWLLVNIQDPKEFQCQVLNRDLWSNPGVKTIISEHFIFWQQYRQSEQAQRYMTFYKVNQWPYIAIIDPRTGENMVTWSSMDAGGFPEVVTEFLSLHPSLESPTKDQEPPRKRAKREPNCISEMDEEAQIAAAIKASLEETMGLNDQQDETEEDSLGFDDSNMLTNGQKAENKGISEQEAPTPGTSKQEEEETDGNGVDLWKKYLGNEGDPSTKLVIRFPDGNREIWNVPSSTKLKALFLYVRKLGYPVANYEIVTNFPRKNLNDLDQESTNNDLVLNINRFLKFIRKV